MIKILSRFSLACHILVLVPFLFSDLPDWYPQWTISLAFVFGLLAAVGSLILIILNKRKKISTERSTLITVITTLALSAVEFGFILWILRGLAVFD